MYDIQFKTVVRSMTGHEHIHPIHGSTHARHDLAVGAGWAVSEEAGKCTGFVYELGRAFDEDEDIFDQADSISGEALEFIVAAINTRSVLKPSAAKAADVNKYLWDSTLGQPEELG